MSNLKSIYIFFIISTITFCHSTYIKTDEFGVPELPTEPELTEELPTTTAVNIQDILNEIIKEDSEKVEEVKTIFIDNISIQQSAEVPKSSESNSEESRPIFTGDLFEIHLTIKRNWTDDFVDQKSEKFKELDKLIDTDLISFFDNQLNKDNSIKRGSFKLKNILPSTTDNYLYVTLIAESSENVTGQIMYEKIENWLLLYTIFYDLEVSREGFDFKSITNEDLKKFDKHIECENLFCTKTPESSLNHFSQEQETSEEIELETSSTDVCSPNEQFNRGSTSIYIFENNHKCVENVKKRSLLSSSQQCSGNAQKPESDSSNGSEGYDDLIVAASELHLQTEKPENMKDDEVIVVVRKRGDKVFIEI